MSLPVATQFGRPFWADEAVAPRANRARVTCPSLPRGERMDETCGHLAHVAPNVRCSSVRSHTDRGLEQPSAAPCRANLAARRRACPDVSRRAARKAVCWRPTPALKAATELLRRRRAASGASASDLQLLQRLVLDLPDSLARDVERCGRPRRASSGCARHRGRSAARARGRSRVAEGLERFAQRLLGEEILGGPLLRYGDSAPLVGDELAELGLLLFVTDRLLQGRPGPVQSA